MSLEIIISALARLNELLDKKFQEHKKRLKKFKQMQMMLVVLSVSISLVLFVIYSPSVLQMIFILAGFNILFFISFRPKSSYNEVKVKKMMQEVVFLQVKLRKFLMEEEVSFDGVKCSSEEGWICDKWGFYKEDERIDYAEFLYDKSIKGLYMQALKNKK
jgi:hypothetical protein